MKIRKHSRTVECDKTNQLCLSWTLHLHGETWWWPRHAVWVLLLLVVVYETMNGAEYRKILEKNCYIICWNGLVKDQNGNPTENLWTIAAQRCSLFDLTEFELLNIYKKRLIKRLLTLWDWTQMRSTLIRSLVVKYFERHLYFVLIWQHKYQGCV